jgi:endonuclease-3
MTTLLSLRTKDENTALVASQLFNTIQTPQELLQIPQNKLEIIIKPTGMYKKKTQTILEVSKILIEQYNSQVPTNKDELLSIKGIGEKTANIVLNNAFDLGVIAVDTHVHRLTNMWQIIKTKNEKESSKILNEIIPIKYKNKLNFLLVSFGQSICKVQNPKCNECNKYIKKNCNKLP